MSRRRSSSRRSSIPSITEEAIAEVASVVERSICKVIGLDESTSELSHTSSLMDLGLDSLSMNELAADLTTKTGVDISPTTFFQRPSITSLSSHISQRELMSVLSEGDLSDTDDEDSTASVSHPFAASSNDRPNKDTDTFSIVGMSCRFPGNVSNIDEYWELLHNGSLASNSISFDRWDVSSLAAGSNLGTKGKNQISHASFVQDMEYFDASFFNISKSEADAMSPLQRSLLECAYLALRDAGYSTVEEMKGLNCGVFVGTWFNAGSSERPTNGSNGYSKSSSSVYEVSGSSASIASGRISYLFNFQGPNAVYDTACSSSLVALDAAMSALKEGKCEMALVAGASELFDSKVFESCARAGMLSPTGRCHSWDESADGYLRGEGCGVILLKRADSVSPGSTYANVLGTSIMSDGTSASITAPSE